MQVNLPSRLCYCPLEDGRLLEIRASLRPRNGRAAIKCQIAAADPAWRFTQQVQQIVQWARLSEEVQQTDPQSGTEQQLLLEFNLAASEQRQWELAVVALDRLVRGVWQTASGTSTSTSNLIAAGYFSQVAQGSVAQTALQLDQAQLSKLAALNGVWVVPASHASSIQPTQALHYLGQLHGQPDAAPRIRTCRVWFPLVGSGAHDCLSWVEVAQCAQASANNMEIAITGIDASAQWQVDQVLQAARAHETGGAARWRTAVHFAPTSFVGNSWELALVLADRIGRGRAYAPRARLIASGASSRWQDGVVESVAACQPKCQLILREAQAGDRVLLPQAWQAEMPADFFQQLRAKGASGALLTQLDHI